MIKKIAFFAILVFTSTSCQKISPSHRDVILISIDTLRADHLNLYGYSRETTPNITKFAKDYSGDIFTSIYATKPMTLPSHVTMLTSLEKDTHGSISNGYKMRQDIVTLQSYLKTQGYKTGAVVSSFILDKRFGLSLGFDDYDDNFGKDFIKDKTDDEIFSNWHNFVDKLSRNASESINVAIQWLESNKNKKSFLFLHLWNPHAPYSPPEFSDKYADQKYNGIFDGSMDAIEKQNKALVEMNAIDLTHMIDLYDAEIFYTDFYLGKLFDYIKENNKNALIIITADHGENFEHKNEYFQHGWVIYNCVSRIPFIVCNSKKYNINTKTKGSNLDFAPTILDILGFKILDSFMGKSLYGYNSNLPIHITNGNDMSSIIFGDYKYIRNTYTTRVIGNRIHNNEGDELYNIENDSNEKINLLKDLPDFGNKMKNILQLKEDACKSITALLNSIFELQLPDKSNNLNSSFPDEDTINKLKSLGYTQ